MRVKILSDFDKVQECSGVQEHYNENVIKYFELYDQRVIARGTSNRKLSAQVRSQAGYNQAIDRLNIEIKGKDQSVSIKEFLKIAK